MTRDEKKRLLVMLTLGGLIAGMVAVAFPVKRKWDFYNKTINERRSKIKLYQQQIVNKEPLVGEVARLNDIYRQTGFFMKADDATSAGAQLQQIVRGILDKNKAKIQSTQVTPATIAPENRSEIKANVEFDNVKALMTTLEAFNQHKPTLRVTDATVRPLTSAQTILQGERYVRRNLEDGRLRVTMTIQTFYEIAQ